MPKEIYLVKVGMTMTEGMVSEWYIPDGASVNKGEMLYALETEKVNLDVDAEVSGTVKQLAEVGVLMEPGDVVGYIFEPGEDISTDGLPEARPGAEAGSPVDTAPPSSRSGGPPGAVPERNHCPAPRSGQSDCKCCRLVESRL